MTLARSHVEQSATSNLGSVNGHAVLPDVVEPSPYFRWKHRLLRVLAALLLIPLGPVTFVLMLLIRLTSRGPAIYRQIRVGRHGRTFTLYKLRTMHDEAEEETGPAWSHDDDPRVTWLGRLLRKSHLDELPQLINVLKGEMDLVGPRPERPEFLAILAQKVPNYLDRLQVLPGITGFAQIHLPPDVDTESVRRKLALDLEYIECGTWWLDLRLLVATGLGLLMMKGPYRAALLGLQPRTTAHEITICVPGGSAARAGDAASDAAASGNGRVSGGGDGRAPINVTSLHGEAPRRR